MNRVATPLGTVIKLLLFTMLMLTCVSSVYAPWWDGNWPFKQEINVTVGSGTTDENFAFEIILNSSNVGSGFNWNNECSGDDTGRLRFINGSENAELDFFIESCSVAGENMSVWIEVDENITTSGYAFYMYYGNAGAAFDSNGSETFDLYFNFSNVTLLDEGSGQNQDDLYEVSDSGRAFRIIENSWKIATGFGTFVVANDGSQILELNMFSTDCGEISALKFDTNTGQENSNNYKFCGSQGWALTPDNTYGTLNTWERVYAVLNDFTISATHFHLIGDDDAGGGSTNSTFKDVRVRKYHSPDPTATIGPEITANVTLTTQTPINNTVTANTTIEFTCGAVTPDGSLLENISLYGNWSGGWHLNETIAVNGTSNSTTFLKTFPDASATYSWNCFTENNAGDDDWGNANLTFFIDRVGPVITIDSPTGTIADVTPLINLTSDEIMYTLNRSLSFGANSTECENCNYSNETFLHVAEGSYTLNFYANDSVGNQNGNQTVFTVDMNGTFYDTFTDNSSIVDYNGTTWQQGNITYSGGGAQFYEGIEIGYVDGNLDLIANQWGGSANAGEVDIECPGGDSACWFETYNGTNRSTLDIENGVVTLDSDSTTVGFVMYSEEDVHTRFSPAPHAQEGDNFVAVCYSGSWFYDDNNGCNEAFTPRDTDVLLANLTWGINNVTEINDTVTAGNTSLTSYSINVTDNITRILNITWNEFGTDANNTISVGVSVDNGATWTNTTNGQPVKNITNNTALVFMVNFSSNGTQEIGLDDMNITWTNTSYILPTVTLYTPENDTDIVRGQLINFSWFVTDNDNDLTCRLYLNYTLNQTVSCSADMNNSINMSTLEIGSYNWTIEVIDQDDNRVNATQFTFNVVQDVRPQVKKAIEPIGTNLFLVTLNVTNLATLQLNGTVWDFVDQAFVAGSFNTLYDDNFTVNSVHNGTVYGWNFTLNPSESQIINYSIISVSDYEVLKNWIVGIEGR